MNISDLQSGDILLFSPEEGSLISKAIVWLTGAPVSHTAMTYQESSKLIEETPPAVRVAKASERFVNRTISVMRKESSTDFSPVIKASTIYLNNEEPYGMSDLYLVGMILIYKKFSPSGPQQQAILYLLKKLVKELSKIINERKYPGKTPMVCSQFVFQCYQDAGEDYELTIKNGNLLKTSLVSENLLEQALNYRPKVDFNLSQDKLLSVESDISEDKVLSMLQNEIGEHSESVAQEILETTHHLAQVIHAISHEKELSQAKSSEGLLMMQQQAAMFVTPADLLEHCPDLTKIGEIKI